jgi:hypothetical protein
VATYALTYPKLEGDSRYLMQNLHVNFLFSFCHQSERQHFFWLSSAELTSSVPAVSKIQDYLLLDVLKDESWKLNVLTSVSASTDQRRDSCNIWPTYFWQFSRQVEPQDRAELDLRNCSCWVVHCGSTRNNLDYPTDARNICMTSSSYANEYFAQGHQG